MHATSHRLWAIAFVGILALAVPACGGDESSTDRFEKAAREAQQSTVAPSTTESIGGSGSEGSDPADTTDSTTTAVVSKAPGDSLAAGVAAYSEVLGPTIRALEYIQHFPVGDESYASLQYQVPDKPQNVDQRDWRNGKVGEPKPVQLNTSSGGTLEENLFTTSEVNWAAIAAAMPGAQALVEQKLGTTFEGSDGVTHIIAVKDLPFSPNTVVRVYVDGGDRSGGGYVQYLADGTLDKVQA